MRLVCRLAEVQGEAVMALVPWLHSASRKQGASLHWLGCRKSAQRGERRQGAASLPVHVDGALLARITLQGSYFPSGLPCQGRPMFKSAATQHCSHLRTQPA